MPDPQYRLFPHNYVYNTKIKRHILKSGEAYRKLIRDDPSCLVETSTMFSPPPGAKTIQLPLPPARDIPVPGPHIGEPLPQPTPLLTSTDEEDEAMRNRVRAIIQQEIKQNPAQYADRSADEMSSLFRQLLIDKLAPPASSKKSKPAVKPAAKSKRFMFKARPPLPESEDESEDEIDYDE